MASSAKFENIGAYQLVWRDDKRRPVEFDSPDAELSIAAIAGLENLDLGCLSIMPRDLDFIADCPTLQSLDVRGGFSDDSTARRIGESSTLQRVSLLQDCYMTDAAIDLLCHNKNLESLSISGLISKQAALKLKDLPRLTSSLNA